MPSRSPSRILFHFPNLYRNQHQILRSGRVFRPLTAVTFSAAAAFTIQSSHNHNQAFAFSQHSTITPSFLKHHSSQRHTIHTMSNNSLDALFNLTTLDDLQPSSSKTEDTSVSSSSPSPPSPLLTSLLSRTIPPLTPNAHKGSSGRIAIIGGSPKYTGAPYYAAMASLRCGMDLVTVHCANEASGPIKGYSPELMVDPFYKAIELEEIMSSSSNSGNGSSGITDSITTLDQVSKMVQHIVPSLIQGRIHSLVIGPGMGRCPIVMEAVSQIIRGAIQQGIPIVLDADALYLIGQEPYQNLLEEELKIKLSSVSNSKNDAAADVAVVVLTPNVVEYKRLVDSIGEGSEERLKDKLKGVILIVKGQYDTIEICTRTTRTTTVAKHHSHNGQELVSMQCRQIGGLKRSGGIGDVLAGMIGSFLAWNQILKALDHKGSASSSSGQLQDTELVVEEKVANINLILSCWFACALTKRATKVAFDKRRRSMTAPDILEEIGMVIDEYTSSTILNKML